MYYQMCSILVNRFLTSIERMCTSLKIRVLRYANVPVEKLVLKIKQTEKSK